MALECPKCGSRYLRPSRPRNSAERMGRLRFLDPLRCMDCNTRFVAKTFEWSEIGYARCPACHRMDLNGWSETSYKAPFWMEWLIALGASRYRCEYCRVNFASFRRRKEAFTFSRWKKRAERMAEESTRPRRRQGRDDDEDDDDDED